MRKNLITNGILLAIIVVVMYLLIKQAGKTYESFTSNKITPPDIYYINLDKAMTRNERFKERANEMGLRINRVRGMTPDDIENLNIIKPSKCYYNTNLELSCSISHLKAIHTAYHNMKGEDDLGLIMEDDIMFLKEPNWDKIIDSAPKDWDILQLFVISPEYMHIYENPKDDWVKHEYEMTSCGAYVMTKRSIRKLLQVFVPEYETRDWDKIKTIDFLHVPTNCVADYFIYLYLNTYVYTQILFNEEGADSYIHPDHLDRHRIAIDRITNLFLEQEKRESS